MDVVETPIDKVVPYARNPRRNDAAVATVAASLAEFGWRQPIVVDETMVIVAGHTRYEAAKRLGMTVVPVHVAKGLSAAQARAYRLMDNRSHQNAAWDDELLKLELDDLRLDEFDLTLTGFSDEELGRLLDGLGAGDREDEVPTPPADPVTRPGDLWRLGPHRLLCGDATVATDVAKALGGAVPHLMVSDPPYGVSYDPGWRNQAGVSATARTGKVANDDRADWREAWSLFPGEVAYVWHAGVHARTVAESLEACGFHVRAQIVWAKPRFVLGRGDYHWQHEPCFYAVRASATGHWQGGRDQSTLWNIGAGGHEDDATVHSTQKPVECMRRPIVNNSARGDLVYEPFAGSGSTLIAAETTGRVCLAIEIDPRYCDVIVDRWQRFAGGQAVLDDDGRSFGEVAASPR